MIRRTQVEVKGMVQGVGFRPFVHGLAVRLGLSGHVFNDTTGVFIEIEGEPPVIEQFLGGLKASPPPMSRIQSVKSHPVETKGETSFRILESAGNGAVGVIIPPDLTVCDDCLAELNNPSNRRYKHAFINCTNCGPRYTIIEGVPYDRSRTTMAGFPMCDLCRAEYEDPGNRRFHAEATCCPDCGPHLLLASPEGYEIERADPIREAAHLLTEGKILAVKGIGGFHLACDATNANAVNELRRRKQRDLKPFAVMARNFETASTLVLVDGLSCSLLEGSERPIVLMRKNPSCQILAEGVAPRNARLGVMLPYTPVHHMLLEEPLSALVMTSGNMSNEPIANENEDAFHRLGELADAFLVHNRRIRTRTDDSVMQISAGAPRFLRRSRGYAPFPVTLGDNTSGHEILAVGAELNGVACLTRNGQAYLSHHLGDLDYLPAWEAFRQAEETLARMLEVKPGTVAHDLHPAYATTRHARSLKLPEIAVQHHHAHIASVLAEERHNGPVIGVSFDGFGWGSDGTAWGGEFLVCDLSDYTRVGSLQPFPLPGGDAAAKHPPRVAYALLCQAYGAAGAEPIAERLLPGLNTEDRRVIGKMITSGLNCPMTSSAGRLFDAAAALCGICDINSYHAQAPMELEGAAWTQDGEKGYYEASLNDHDGLFCLVITDIIRSLIDDLTAGIAVSICAARFHNSVAHGVVTVCERIRDRDNLSTVALSGGVFANVWLLEKTWGLLRERDFEVLANSVVPPGDGGVSLGQAAVAARRLSCV